MIDFGNILCKIGVHKKAWITFRFAQWQECLRCGKHMWEPKKWFRKHR